LFPSNTYETRIGRDVKFCIGDTITLMFQFFSPLDDVSQGMVLSEFSFFFGQE